MTRGMVPDSPYLADSNDDDLKTHSRLNQKQDSHALNKGRHHKLKGRYRI